MGPDFKLNGDNYICVIEKNEACKDAWPDATYIVGDLNHMDRIPLPMDTFDEVHAYEMLNLLPGDASDFFRLWRRLWMVMSPGGQIFASTPHWDSRYIYSYPGQVRVYTPELIDYLDQDSQMHAKEDFSELWPKPYCFKSVMLLETTDRRAFQFRLAKC